VEFSDELASPQGRRCAAAVKADKTKALDMFNKGEGGFLDRDLYVFCFNNSDGKIVALGNPNAKQLLGSDARNLKDSTGKVYGPELYAGGRSLRAVSLRSATRFQSRGPTQSQCRKRAS